MIGEFGFGKVGAIGEAGAGEDRTAGKFGPGEIGVADEEGAPEADRADRDVFQAYGIRKTASSAHSASTVPSAVTGPSIHAVSRCQAARDRARPFMR